MGFDWWELDGSIYTLFSFHILLNIYLVCSSWFLYILWMPKFVWGHWSFQTRLMNVFLSWRGFIVSTVSFFLFLTCEVSKCFLYFFCPCPCHTRWFISGCMSEDGSVFSMFVGLCHTKPRMEFTASVTFANAYEEFLYFKVPYMVIFPCFPLHKFYWLTIYLCTIYSLSKTKMAILQNSIWSFL